MALYTVVSFNVTVVKNTKGHDHIELSLDLLNSSGNPKKVAYRLNDDTRHSLPQMVQDLNDGLNLAVSRSIKIEIGEYLERMYIFIKLPFLESNGKIVKKQLQYTAHKL
ncbi:TPA: hypothetical protein I8W54_003013 [Morganella morganii]|nr:hypothetical protein [Morganella morganii]